MWVDSTRYVSFKLFCKSALLKSFVFNLISPQKSHWPIQGVLQRVHLALHTIFWYFLDGKNVVRSIHYEHAAYNMLPRNIYAAAHNMLPQKLNIPIIKSNTWPREPLPNQLTRKLGALELISPFWMWEQEKQMNKKMKRDNSTKSQHQVLQVSLGDLFFLSKMNIWCPHGSTYSD